MLAQLSDRVDLMDKATADRLGIHTQYIYTYICICYDTVYVQILRDINSAVFAFNLSSMKFKSLKFHKTIVIHLKHKV